MERETPALKEVAAPELDGAQVVDHEKTDAAEDHQGAHRDEHERLVLKAGYAAGVKGEAGVAEGHDREEICAVPCVAVRQRRLKRLSGGELEPEEKRAQRLDGKHRDDHAHDERPEPAYAGDAVGVHEGELARKRNAPPDDDKEERGARHDARAAELHKAQQNRLPEARKVAPHVDHAQAGDAHRRTRREQGVHRAHPRVGWRRSRQHEEHGTQEDRAQEAEHDQPFALHVVSLAGVSFFAEGRSPEQTSLK